MSSDFCFLRVLATFWTRFIWEWSRSIIPETDRRFKLGYWVEKLVGVAKECARSRGFGKETSPRLAISSRGKYLLVKVVSTVELVVVSSFLLSFSLLWHPFSL